MSGGLKAILGADERAALALRELYTAWGYQRWRVNDFEDYDLYARNRDFLPGDSVLTFNDFSGRLKALKPDVTLSIVRHAPPASQGAAQAAATDSGNAGHRGAQRRLRATRRTARGRGRPRRDRRRTGPRRR